MSDPIDHDDGYDLASEQNDSLFRDTDRLILAFDALREKSVRHDQVRQEASGSFDALLVLDPDLESREADVFMNLFGRDRLANLYAFHKTHESVPRERLIYLYDLLNDLYDGSDQLRRQSQFLGMTAFHRWLFSDLSLSELKLFTATLEADL